MREIWMRPVPDGDVTPIRGVTLGGGEQALNVQVTVSPQDPIPA